MFLKDSNEILAAIQQLFIAHSPGAAIEIAVAFWGLGAEQYIDDAKQYRILCNLDAGGTNPEVIECLRKRENIKVRHLSTLHAKVVSASGGAVVSSANFSANGLGLEGARVAGWQEAGFLLGNEHPAYGDVRQWFSRLWFDAGEVDEVALADARRKWHTRHEGETEVAQLEPRVIQRVNGSPEIDKGDLFEDGFKPRNRMHSARPWLIELAKKIGLRSSEAGLISIYAAHLIWTFSGRTIDSWHGRITSPDQVMRHAKQGRGNKARNLIQLVTTSDDAPTAVRCWAERYCERR